MIKIFGFKKKKTRRSSEQKGNNKLFTVPLKRHWDKNGGHHHIIFDSIDDNYVSVGTTSKLKKGKNSNSTNYRCENDILGNGQVTYLRRKGTVDKKSNYFGEKVGKMSVKDYKQAKTYAYRAKENYLSQKKKK